MSIDKDLLDRLMEGRSPGDLFGKTGILSELTKALAERALSTEIDVHLDEERGGEVPEGQNQPPNRRNGRSQKAVTTDSGKVVLDIPRDRNDPFDPLLIAKYQRRFPEFDRKIVSMYARGMTPREIQGHIEEIYGAEAAEAALADFEDGDLARQYPAIAPSWRRAWNEVIPFLDYPPQVRRLIHTTNAIEALNSKIRRAVRTRGHFPSDDAAAKLIYLALNATSQEWKRSVRDWHAVKSQFAIMFEDRFPMA